MKFHKSQLLLAIIDVLFLYFNIDSVVSKGLARLHSRDQKGERSVKVQEQNTNRATNDNPMLERKLFGSDDDDAADAVDIEKCILRKPSALMRTRARAR